AGRVVWPEGFEDQLAAGLEAAGEGGAVGDRLPDRDRGGRGPGESRRRFGDDRGLVRRPAGGAGSVVVCVAGGGGGPAEAAGLLGEEVGRARFAVVAEQHRVGVERRGAAVVAGGEDREGDFPRGVEAAGQGGFVADRAADDGVAGVAGQRWAGF